MRLSKWFVFVFAMSAIFALFVYRGTTQRELERERKLTNIGQAILNYSDYYGHGYPPSVRRNEHGDPMHSWRALIASFVQKTSFNDLYDTGEPWDGPSNSRLKDALPETAVRNAFQFSASPNECDTDVLMVTGLNPTGPDVVIVEMSDTGIHWMEPRDISLRSVLSLAVSKDTRLGCSISIVEGELVFRDKRGTQKWLLSFAEDDD